MLRLLKRAGWYQVSQKGSHMKLKHDDHKHTIIFPDHGAAELGKGLEAKIRKQAGI